MVNGGENCCLHEYQRYKRIEMGSLVTRKRLNEYTDHLVFLIRAAPRRQQAALALPRSRGSPHHHCTPLHKHIHALHQSISSSSLSSFPICSSFTLPSPQQLHDAPGGAAGRETPRPTRQLITATKAAASPLQRPLDSTQAPCSRRCSIA